MKKIYFRAQFILLFSLLFTSAFSSDIRGVVLDKNTKEPLFGATVIVSESGAGTVTNIDGEFELLKPSSGHYTLVVQYLSYQTLTIKDGDVKEVEGELLTLEMLPDDQLLSEVEVVRRVRQNTENAMLTATRNSLVIQSGVSSQEIRRAQDNNASEVIRRIPGISLIDEKFVMVRGLSQRYNNVWINGSGVPGSEADSRAFSFDIIPSSQLDNMQIVKSPTSEIPADFSGGFILIKTKDVLRENATTFSIGTGINSEAHFQEFRYAKGSKTDILGFDNTHRPLPGAFHAPLKSIGGHGVDLLGNGFNNDWVVKTKHPWANTSVGLNFNRHWTTLGNRSLYLIGSATYSNRYTTYRDMKNSLFGVYDVKQNRSSYLRQSMDDQYNHHVRAGAMLNLSFEFNNRNRIEFRNIFNQLARDRYTHRKGFSAQSNQEESGEYYYSSRTTYNGQFNGKHELGANKLDWGIGYAYSNRHLPDRKRYLVDDALESGVIGLTTGNDINREFTRLNEHIISGSLNFERALNIKEWTPTIKAGGYAERRTRSYMTRSFIYNWNNANNNMPQGFRRFDVPTQLMRDENYAVDKLYLLEELRMRNDYEGINNHFAGYVSANLPMGKLNLYTGLRFEHNTMELIGNTKDYEKSPISSFYTDDSFFPSVNATYKLTKKQQFRLSYGQTINRPEFREVTPSVFYDFDLAASVQGNPTLNSCFVNNSDFRYEFYPNTGEQLSVALFHKYFVNPIEWTYTVAGGTDLIYSFQNAERAYSLGIEFDFRKNLDFIGLKGLSLNFNSSFIKSKVLFSDKTMEKDRPMQGQSPYLINTGLFYRNERWGFNMSLLYNRIGKRIIGVGRSVGTIGGENSGVIPDSYEMPRNVIDLSFTKQVSKHWEIRCSVRDLLAERVSYKQFDKVRLPNDEYHQVVQTAKEYRPGQTIRLSLNYNF